MRNLALVWVLAACLLGCGGKSSDNTFTDKRDGKVYRIVEINGQTWFAENLNYAVEGSVCYEDKDANCATYGRMYNWETALKVCPAGTHLPSDEEWTTLVDYAGGEEKAGTMLKSSTGWENENGVPAGTDDYGFSTLPGGYGNGSGRFQYAGHFGYWWSATERNTNTGTAWYRGMHNDRENVNRGNFGGKIFLFSVRCVVGKERRK